MKTVLVSVFGAVVLSLVSVPALHAQWPMGRDTSLKIVKDEESCGTITASGRFQVFVSPNIKGHTFMLDTETGRVWEVKKDHASGEFSLQRVLVEQIDPKPGDKPADQPKIDKRDTPTGQTGTK